MARDDGRDTVTLGLPASRPFADLPRVGRASLLRIHRSNPGNVGDLATSVMDAAAELAAEGSEVVVEFRVTDAEVSVDLTGNGRTLRISVPRT